ncbi:hypothetical protein LRU_00366 [Ligilactobacillus ruminis SPM0211]|uniref:Uncharacterized protein n=1 Tax=Ligilactobacillus ruminis SPM0211 TaxID=1040964 RepID=F7QY81_9LACO|nr:hypothetical protein LRU_00366 [Ligilactobacillus ruminis SPM0211]
MSGIFYFIKYSAAQGKISFKIYRHVLFLGCSAMAGDCHESAKTRPHPGF